MLTVARKCERSIKVELDVFCLLEIAGGSEHRFVYSWGKLFKAASLKFETVLSLHLATRLPGLVFCWEFVKLVSGLVFWVDCFVVFVVFYQTLFQPPLTRAFCQLSQRSFLQFFSHICRAFFKRLSNGHESISDQARTFVLSVAIMTSAFVKTFRPLAWVIHRLIHEGRNSSSFIMTVNACPSPIH